MSTHRFLYFRCESQHETLVTNHGGWTADDIEHMTCKKCGLAAKAERVEDFTLPGTRSVLHQSGDQCEKRTDQAFVNVAKHLRESSQHSMRTADEWTAKERKGYEERKRLADEKDRSCHRRSDKDMRMVGEVPPRLHRKMIQESGDPQYWSRDNCANMKRHGLYWGRS